MSRASPRNSIRKAYTIKEKLREQEQEVVSQHKATLLNIQSDVHAQNWCEFVASVSTPISSVMFAQAMQYTTYHYGKSLYCKRQ